MDGRPSLQGFVYVPCLQLETGTGAQRCLKVCARQRVGKLMACVISNIQGRCGFSRTDNLGRAPEGAPKGADFESGCAALGKSGPVSY